MDTINNHSAILADSMREAVLRGRAPQEAGSFMRIRKRHHLEGRPFALLDYYVETSLFRRFPRGAERRAVYAVWPG